MTEQRPWGTEHVIYAGEYLVKRLSVDEGQRLSLQYHPEKTETLVVVSGDPVVELDGMTMACKPGSVVHIPRLKQHRIAAPKGDVVIIECSTPVEGTVRLEDDYGRA